MTEGGLTDVAEGFQRARDDAERAIALDPTLTSAYLVLAKTQINCDWNWDAANTSITKAAALEPGSVEVLRIRSYRARTLGNLDQAIKLQEQVVTLDPLRATSYARLGYLLYAAGRYDAALADLIAKYRTTSAYQVAQVYSFRGETDKSFEWLEYAYKQRDPGLPEIKSNPLFKKLYRDPRYTEFLKKMRLPT